MQWWEARLPDRAVVWKLNLEYNKKKKTGAFDLSFSDKLFHTPEHNMDEQFFLAFFFISK